MLKNVKCARCVKCGKALWVFSRPSFQEPWLVQPTNWISG